MTPTTRSAISQGFHSLLSIVLNDANASLEMSRMHLQLDVAAHTNSCMLSASTLFTLHVTNPHSSWRKPLVRAGFIRRISQYPVHYLITLDEVSNDNRTYACMWGRASRGEQV